MVGGDYISWLFERYGTRGYEQLFDILAKKDYIWQFVLDENRAKAGLALREQCAYEMGVYLSDVADGSCSCLEMLCALSSSMYDMCGQHDPKYFLIVLLTNLGLDYYGGAISGQEEAEINYILDRWLTRNYTPNGKGSIFNFRSKHIGKDIRNMDIWSQMNLYLNVFYPLDDNYLGR